MLSGGRFKDMSGMGLGIKAPRVGHLGLLGFVLGLSILTACGDDDDASTGGTMAPTVAEMADRYPEGTVAGVLSRDGRFGTLLQVLELAEVRVGPPGAQEVIGTAAESMAESGWDHTLFAPTDSAFDDLNEDEIDTLLSDPEAATQFVRRHSAPSLIAGGDLDAGDITNIGGSVEVTVEGTIIRYGGARVIEIDLQASNGIIHVIDGVVTP